MKDLTLLHGDPDVLNLTYEPQQPIKNWHTGIKNLQLGFTNLKTFRGSIALPRYQPLDTAFKGQPRLSEIGIALIPCVSEERK